MRWRLLLSLVRSHVETIHAGSTDTSQLVRYPESAPDAMPKKDGLTPQLATPYSSSRAAPSAGGFGSSDRAAAGPGAFVGAGKKRRLRTTTHSSYM